MDHATTTTIDVSLFVTVVLFIVNIIIGWLGKLLYGASTTTNKEIHRLTNEVHALALKQAERYVSHDQFERVVSALSKQIDSLETSQGEGFDRIADKLDRKADKGSHG